MQTELSKQDIRILSLIQRDASMTTGEIAEQANMSQSPCWRRINRIEQEGIIMRRVAVLDRLKLGMEVVTFTSVNLSTHGRQNLEDFEQSISNFPEVVECYTMAGMWDYMLKIITKDIRHYEAFVRDHLTSVPMIRELHSHIAVTEIKNTSELPLATQL